MIINISGLKTYQLKGRDYSNGPGKIQLYTVYKRHTLKWGHRNIKNKRMKKNLSGKY